MNASLLPAERVSLTLRGLYQSFGYTRYRVGKFEEYDLYARNRNFLSDDRILTFSDINGQVMALKPDVTLSIIKNTRGDDRMRKVWYTENVYRVPRGGDSCLEPVSSVCRPAGPGFFPDRRLRRHRPELSYLCQVHAGGRRDICRTCFFVCVSPPCAL